MDITSWWNNKKDKEFKDLLAKGQSLLLIDEPSDLDEFGYEHYVDTLEAITKEAKTPFVVGVLGKWGVGKTTLVNKFLRKRLQESASDIGFVYFDAWKYQKNAFYRQFLAKMKADLDIDDNLKLIFYTTVTTKKQSYNLYWDKEEVKNLVLQFIFWYLIILAASFLWQFNYNIEWFYKIVLVLVPSSLATILSRGVSGLKNLIKVKDWVEENSPLFSDEQFEEVFKRYVSTAKKKFKKIVIVIDNLDRCTNEIAIELLGTIKTFLNIDGCLYIVPVDEGALLNHLKKGLITDDLGANEKDLQSRDFLKKFFQVTVRLSPFLKGDLEKYISKISCQIAIPFKDDEEKDNIANLVLNAFSHTPRKIKQFYNNLSTTYLLALAQEELGNIDTGLVTNNLTFLSKLIILQEEWPNFFKVLLDDSDALQVADTYLRNGTEDGPKIKEIKKQLEDQNLSDFLQASRPYQSLKLEQFINLKREGYAGVLGVSSELKISLISGREESVLSTIKKSNEQEKQNIVQQISSLLNQEQRQNKFASVFNILNMVLSIFDLIPDGYKAKLADAFTQSAAKTPHLAKAGSYKSESLFKVLNGNTKTQFTQRDLILDEHSKVLESDDPKVVLNKIIETYSKNVDILTSQIKTKISDLIYRYYQDNNLKVSVLDTSLLLLANKTVTKSFISEGFIDQLIYGLNTITNDPSSLDELSTKTLQVNSQIIPFLSKKQIAQLLNNLNGFITNPKIPEWNPGKEAVLNFYINIIKEEKITKDYYEVVAPHYILYINNPVIPQKLKLDIVNLINKLSQASETAKDDFKKVYEQQISSSNEFQDIKSLLLKFAEEKVEFVTDLKRSIVERVLQPSVDEGQKTLLLEGLNGIDASKKKTLYLEGLKQIIIESKDFVNIRFALQKIELIRSQLNDGFLDGIFDKLLEWSASFTDLDQRFLTHSFLIPSYNLLSDEHKEKLLDVWLAILDNDGESQEVKNKISGYLQSGNVIQNIPKSRKEGLPRKLFEILKKTPLPQKESLVNILFAHKLLFEKKTSFISEIEQYGLELYQNPEGSSERLTGKTLLKNLGAKDKFKIVKATYGTHSEKIIDITEQLNKSIVNGTLTIQLTNRIGGDPDEGISKKGKIKYAFFGVEQEKEFDENSNISLP